MKGNILMLVEGSRIDFRLMERLLGLYGIDKEHKIIPYETNIYVLYQTMFQDADPSEIDIQQHLKSREASADKKQILDEYYSDIILVFDFDPQDTLYSEAKIREMAEYFVESTVMGKLYLNYPMVEAFYHMRSIPDIDYDSYAVTLAELRSKTYKSRVNAENRNRDYSKFAVTKNECDTVISQNIRKAWLVANGKIQKCPPSMSDILGSQIEKMKHNDEIFVLCTCVFYIVDYNHRLVSFYDLSAAK
jgi:hypothetical protein